MNLVWVSTLSFDGNVDALSVFLTLREAAVAGMTYALKQNRPMLTQAAAQSYADFIRKTAEQKDELVYKDFTDQHDVVVLGLETTTADACLYELRWDERVVQFVDVKEMLAIAAKAVGV